MRLVRSVTLAAIAILGLLAGTASTVSADGGKIRPPHGAVPPRLSTVEADPGDPGVPPGDQ